MLSPHVWGEMENFKMKDIELKKLQKNEALERLKDLTKTFSLDNRLFEDCMLYKNLCDIKDYPKLEKLIKKFEREHNAVAYYCFLTKYWNMDMLAILYVSSYVDDWKEEKEFVCSYNKCHYISSYVYNLDIPKYSEFGDIIISSENGILTRIG